MPRSSCEGERLEKHEDEKKKYLFLLKSVFCFTSEQGRTNHVTIYSTCSYQALLEN